MSKEDQEVLRKKLNRYLEVNGIKAKKIAGDINLDPGCLSRFRKGKVFLWTDTYEKLQLYLESKI